MNREYPFVALGQGHTDSICNVYYIAVPLQLTHANGGKT